MAWFCHNFPTDHFLHISEENFLYLFTRTDIELSYSLHLIVLTRAPPPAFPPPGGKVKKISLPEDVDIRKVFEKHLDSKYYDAIKYCSTLTTSSVHFSFLIYIPR